MTASGPLWRVSVGTSPESEEATAELLEQFFAQPAASYTHLETSRTTVSVYLSQRSLWTRARRTELVAALKALKTPSPLKIVLAKVRAQDWALAWMKHFKPIEIGSKLLIKPSWSRRQPRKGQVLVVLDPGLSFGTGQHPTTAFCLRQIASRRKPVAAQAFLDLGTGSGILAIAAAKLGYSPVKALDFDVDAIRAAQANAKLNGVSALVRIQQADVTKLPSRTPKQYSVICANLISNLLLDERERIVARLAPGGALVLAGILEVEFARVAEAYNSAGLRLAASRAQREWRSGAFVWPTR